MNGEYCGRLSRLDPLYYCLDEDVMPLLGVAPGGNEYHVFKANSSKDVYLYECEGGPAVVGKFYSRSHEGYNDHAGRCALHEFHNLSLLRSYGLHDYPHYVARPLAFNASCNNVLFEEFCKGEPLSAFIDRALYDGDEGGLYECLTALGFFLATLHNRTANGHPVYFRQECSYMGKLMEQLQEKSLIGYEEAEDFMFFCGRWHDRPEMWEDRQVLIHGDATPSNFIFSGGISVTAIDLERLKRADRAHDLGRIAGELKHMFLMARGEGQSAEPFIGHLLGAYSSHFPDRVRAFFSITARIPFYMAETLLRIARNDWCEKEHRLRLIAEAFHTLRSGE
ncbi:MAG: phosphotransferase [Candidatus Eremiobacteraeota bacterium]|nr:phosphotransferase [Candidatus Eremiobacteraeota bacterium]